MDTPAGTGTAAAPVTDTPRRAGLVLLSLIVVAAVANLSVAVANVALPSIQTDLEFSQANLQWVISAYALVFGGFLLLGGRISDILGRRRMFMDGLGLFVAASVAGALGALGALCVILALRWGGKPIYVAPLVFAGAPVARAASRRKAALRELLSTRCTSAPDRSASAQAITIPGKPPPVPR